MYINNMNNDSGSNNNRSNGTAIVTSSKRSSFSSRASKIPQKIAQSSFFSLKPSASSIMDNNGGRDSPSPSIFNGDSNNRLSARIGQMLFRQRTTSESVIKESRSFSTHSSEYSSQSLGRNSLQFRSLDIRKNQQQNVQNSNSNSLPTSYEKRRDHLSIASTFINNNHNDLTVTNYSISSPERTDFDSYYYTSNTAGSVTTATTITTPKDENSLFSPLSFSNSSVSSLTDSILNANSTPPQSPMSPVLFQSITTTCLKSVNEFADILIERCNWFLELYDLQYSHIREVEMILNQTQLLINSIREDNNDDISVLDAQLKQLKEVIGSTYHSPLATTDQQASIKSVIQDITSICQKCISISTELPTLSTTTDLFKKETPKVLSSLPTEKEYQTMKSDQIDENASWFRQHFVGKPYQTFIGSLQSCTTQHKLPLIDINEKKKPHNTTTNIPKRGNSKSLLNSFLSSSSSSLNSSNNQSQQQRDNNNIGIISVIQERANDFSGPRNGAAAILGSQYRIIVRSTEPEQIRCIIHECMAKETQTQLESRGESHKMDKMISSEFKRPRPFNHSQYKSSSRMLSSFATTVSSENQNTFTSRMIRAAILSVCPNIDLRSFKELSAESTIMAGLEKELLKYDEIHIPKHYKFGLLTIKNNQTTEEAWFSNTGLSNNLKDFLTIMGKKIELKGYQGYSAGLDTKTGESGEFAYVSKWNDYDIMFHVAPLMPSQANDRQQVLRKKHIGNDIVCIVYLEGDQLFNPKAIRSQFLHVYVVVRREIIQDYDNNNERKQWRVEVLSNKNVGDFGPPLPSPPIFNNDKTLKEFLTLKLINAENAALKSEKFRVPNNKARLGLLSNHIDTGLSFNVPQVVRSASTNRIPTTTNRYNKSLPLNKKPSREETEESLLKKRPKSVNNNKSTHHLQGGSRLLREAILDEEKRRVVVMASTDIPPMPAISRSTLLQDFKNNFTRKKSTSKSLINSTTTPSDQLNKKKVLRKSSQLKISSIPEDASSVNHHQEIATSKPIDEEEMFVGKDINISSESFISTEQLFSITTDDDVDGDKKPLPRNNSTTSSLYSPSKFVITSPTTTTALSDSNGSSW